MSSKTPEANEPGATASVPRQTAKKSFLQTHLFWVSRVLDALVPSSFLRTKPNWRSPQSWAKLAPLAVFVAVIGGVLLLQLSLRKPSVECSFKIPKPVKGAIPGRPVDCIQLEVAQTQSTLVRGLSGRTHLARDQGMLFIFPEVDRHCIWMKDMRFSLDILWLNADKRVLHIEHNVSPDTFPRSYCVKDSKYVIEVNAGTAGAGGIQPGQQLKL